MAKLDDTLLPTDFAIALLVQCEFVGDKTAKGANLVEIGKREKLIAHFQMMSITEEFESALIAFHGIDMTEEQRDALRIVHTSTKPWIKGLAISACLDSITFRNLKNNEFAEAIKTIMEQIGRRPEDGDGRRMKGILVKVAERKPAT